MSLCRVFISQFLIKETNEQGSGRTSSLRHHKQTVGHVSVRGGVNGGGAATVTSSVLSLGFSMSSVNDPTTPSGAGPSTGTTQKKSNWEVIEHYHKSGLHGASSTSREKQVNQLSK